MPFQKGKSGNPGGRPKVASEVKELAQQHGPDAIKELVRLAKEATNEQTRVAAIKELLDRGYGKATQAHEHSGPEGGPIVAQWLPSV